LYREEGLAMRIRQRRRIRWRGAVTSPAATRPNERWSMDFVSDCVATGRVIRMLTIAVAHGNVRPSRSILRWVDYECAACWIGLRASADCRKPWFWTTGRSFAVGHWRPGAKTAECDWSLFNRESPYRTRT